jgi:hypothetical protein
MISDRAEPVEALPFFRDKERGQGLDKLSPDGESGVGVDANPWSLGHLDPLYGPPPHSIGRYGTPPPLAPSRGQ